ncbi:MULTISPECIES: hypothetical protein [unclassified Gluconobacter]|uniref:hypothetical protein n=1 Tax=unclassified Gluconobacter TaxID=2644261 RepID=UPI001C043E7B|nr:MULTISPECIES: hypothetical protein [unclassified Gluconobacter]
MSSANRQTSSRTATKKAAAASRSKKAALPTPETVIEASYVGVEPVASAEVPTSGPFLPDMVCAFDKTWYMREYPDVAASGLDPATHYREAGYREGRKPNRFFDPEKYRAANPDLLEYEDDLLMHFVFYGLNEGRRIS